MDDLINGVLDALHNKVESIIVYAEEESLTEIAVLTACRISDDEEERLSKIIQELAKKRKRYGVIDIDLESFNQWHDTVPLYRKIRQNGKVIWQRG